MYSLIILNSKKNNYFVKKYQLILSRDQLEKIKNSFCWKMGIDGYVVSCNDFLNNKEKATLSKLFPEIDLPLQEFSIEFSMTLENHFFSLEQYLNKVSYPLTKKCAPYLGVSILPFKNRPTFVNGDLYIWYHELGAYEELDTITKISRGFYHPVTKMFLFKKKSQYANYIANFDKLNKTIATMENNDLLGKYFIRVISVYNKKSGELRYRITNEQFDQQSVGFIMLNAFPDDEGLFFRSYEINKKIAKYINNSYDNEINFDFDNNRYFFETLEANDFIYPYQDFLKNLDII